ncbi:MULTISPECIES: DUF5819 family protein [Staphylococcus]|uniref:DUF5819 family protein n=1 Tax=Staphylococcus TaxID=1279 RepID=UPI000D1F2D5C|nr:MULTISPECIES: DUF5819 family protein [Staphylococcus]PTK54582.1 hypothetical protein BUZ33_10700 [Staphylococcus haemolyticus]
MKKLFPLILLVILIFHFTFTILSVGNYNPITHKINREIEGYMNPIFEQNWHLFAPDPISNNTAIQVQYQEKNSNKKSEWLEVTQTMTEQMHKNYFSPYNRIGRIANAVSENMLTVDSETLDLIKKLKKEGKSNELKKIDDLKEKKYNTNLKMLNSYTSAYLKSVYPNKDIKSIKIRILKKEGTPFSKRKEEKNSKWTIIHTTKKIPFDSKTPSLI